MKRFLFLPIMLLICLVMIFPSFGAEYRDIGLLYESWTTEGYPDYVSGVWSTYGNMSNLTIGLIEGEEGEKGKNDILSLIENDSSVTFTTQKYSRNYLVSIMDELEGYIKKGLAFSSGGVYEIENVVKLTLLKDSTEDEISESVKLEMQEKYGDAILFDYGDAFTKEDLIGTIDIGPVKEMIESGNVRVYYTDLNDHEKSNKAFYILLIAALTLSSGLPVFFVRKHKLMRASNDDVISETPLTDKEIESIIKDSEVQYPLELDTKINEKKDDIK